MTLVKDKMIRKGSSNSGHSGLLPSFLLSALFLCPRVQRLLLSKPDNEVTDWTLLEMLH